MAKTKISEFDIDPANNTDINSINIAEGCAPSGINNAIRQLMSDLKEFQTGAGGDSLTAVGVYSDTIGEKTSGAGVTVDGVLLKDNAVTASGGFSGALNGAVGGTTPATGAFTTLSASSTLTVTGAGSIQGLTVGRGAGAVATNTAVGASALTGSGTYNTAVGYQTLRVNDTGTLNTVVGAQAMYSNTTGSSNSVFGQYALGANTTGGANTAIGYNALSSNTTASNNTAVGYQAGYSNTTGAQNTFVGQKAGYANTTGQGITAIGDLVLTANTTGGGNVGLGGTFAGTSTPALYANTTGSYNTATGVGALASNTTANNNTAIGYQAGYSNTTGGGNTFAGYGAGYSSTASDNTFFGFGAGYSVTTGTKNTFIGGGQNGAYFGAGRDVTTGSKNTILGSYSGNQGGLDIRTASNYIVLSDGDGNPRYICNNSGQTLIGSTANISGSNARVQITADGTYRPLDLYVPTTSSYGAIGFINPNGLVGSISTSGSATAYNTSSDYRLKENIAPMTGALATVSALKPVTYTWKADGSDGQGFIAHELQAVVPDCVTGEKDAVDADGNPVYQGIDTSFLVATLTAAIQEQQAIIENLTTRLTALENK